MKITLLDVQRSPDGHINRDLAGGYGSATRYGDSPVARFLSAVKRRGVRLPSLTLGYIAAIFHKEGHEVFFSTDRIAPGSDLVVILSSIVGAGEEMAAGDEVRRESGTPVCYVGTFASVRPDIYMDHGDSVIVGEPESAALRLARGEMPSGEVESQPVEDLDLLPFPNWDFFPVDEYSYFPMIKAKPFLAVSTSRGCPYPCFYYCPYTVLQGRTVRVRSVGNVISELEYLKRKWGVRGILFRDPVFTMHRDRCVELAREMRGAGLGMLWGCETHLETLDKELLDELHAAGLRALNVGIEGIAEEVLKGVRRRMISTAHTERIVRYCAMKGIHVSAFYILGSPEDTEENIKRTVSYAKRLNTEAAQFTISTPYPGTRYYDDIEELIDVHDWSKYTGFYSVFRHKHIPRRRLLRLKERAYAAYYLRLRWMLRMIKITLRSRF